jgi:hypothetical protein
MKVGVTGHQELGNKVSIDWIKGEIMNELKTIRVEQGYSCLAKGADQLFGRLLFENKIDLVAVIPCKNYNTTFKDEQFLEEFIFLKKYSVKEIDLEFDSPSEQAFFEGGKTVVNKSDILFAIWNGLPAKGLGGTADVVNYAKEGNKYIIHINPIKKTIKHIKNGKY